MKKLFNKSFVTNFISVLIIATGYLCPVQQELIKSIGFFALSGAITNWLAIYMLFEKVPLLYGSGVIPNRFEEFKLSIKQLMMAQFFTVENIEQFIETEEQQGSKVLDLEPLLNAVDYERIYQGLVSSIMNSSFGGMLMMMGGEEALVPLKEPFTEKMRGTLHDMVESDRFKAALQQGLDANKISEDIVGKIETVIDKRLSELTPQLVKEMVLLIISEHLGWLVVWGGIFGGLMGAVFAFA
ncbi:MAG: DUF445 domain-containing protein [Methylococcaceae bacterium]|nr:DUF445 domain-containing protein [Methylococcaceae bacterium]MDP2392251.1 DUF445 domain-containing protein [Methylococcaceae bacterium]MDP3389896.1 DUF445 domain-containing protein [Methylococcaceae bacterium]MDP3933810.1 DUF445 domain-containing protein [Methylococcaceae bacterium]MDZ4155613.1 DUF445 domain-containing protein [Methylococcales bacterium]